MGLPPYVGGHEGSGPGGYVDLYLQASEYCGIIHSSSAHFLPMPGGGAEASIAGVEEMVVLLGHILCGPALVRGWGGVRRDGEDRQVRQRQYG